jgi:hypothetical protein
MIGPIPPNEFVFMSCSVKSVTSSAAYVHRVPCTTKLRFGLSRGASLKQTPPLDFLACRSLGRQVLFRGPLRRQWVRMQLPNVNNFIKDLRYGVTYNICAYRKLSVQEMTCAMQVFIQQQGSRQPKQGSVVKIFSLVGLADE